jgi:hypothetical protein
MQLEIPLDTQAGQETTTDGKLTTATVDANATEAALRNKGKPPEEPKPESKEQTEAPKPGAKPEAKPEATLEIKVPEKVDFSAVAKEFAENAGTLSDTTVKLLESKGITKDIIETFIEGQKARAQVTRSELAKAVGGDETLDAVLSWAATGLSPEEVTTYNALLKSPDSASQKVALQSLKAKMDADLGTDGFRVNAEGVPGTRGVEPYSSWAQVTKDMGSKEYKNDPAFRAKVEQRLSFSRLP